MVTAPIGGRQAAVGTHPRGPQEFSSRGSRDSQSEPGPDGYHPSFYGQETPERVPFTNPRGWGITNFTQIEILCSIVRFWQPRADGITGQTIFAMVATHTF